MAYNLRKTLIAQASPDVHPLPTFKVRRGAGLLPLKVNITAVPSGGGDVVVKLGNSTSQSYVLTNNKTYTMYVFNLNEIYLVNSSVAIALLQIEIFSDGPVAVEESGSHLWILYNSPSISPALYDTNYICFYNVGLGDIPPVSGWLSTNRLEWQYESVVVPELTYTDEDTIQTQNWEEGAYGQGTYYRSGSEGSGVGEAISDGVAIWTTLDDWRIARVVIEQEAGLPDAELPWVNDGTSYKIFGE